MKENHIVVRSLKDRKRGRTNWKKLRQLSDQDIEQAAASDPDNPIASPQELKQFYSVYPVAHIDVKQVRKNTALSQSEFAEYFGISLRTLQEWEQGRSVPSTVARNFLRVIEREPEAVQRALK